MYVTDRISGFNRRKRRKEQHTNQNRVLLIQFISIYIENFLMKRILFTISKISFDLKINTLDIWVESIESTFLRTCTLRKGSEKNGSSETVSCEEMCYRQLDWDTDTRPSFWTEKTKLSLCVFWSARSHNYCSFYRPLAI